MDDSIKSCPENNFTQCVERNECYAESVGIPTYCMSRIDQSSTKQELEGENNGSV